MSSSIAREGARNRASREPGRCCRRSNRAAPGPSSPASPGSLAFGGSASSSRDEIRSVRDLSPQQWKSGIAAWLGWLFDGLDMHLYVLVAAPFVAELVGVTDTRNEVVGWYSSWIQAAFLVG